MLAAILMTVVVSVQEKQVLSRVGRKEEIEEVGGQIRNTLPASISIDFLQPKTIFTTRN